MAKFDWNLTNDHRLELTMIGDRYAQTEELSGYDYATGARNGVVASTGYFTNHEDHTTGVGGATQILKYTGYLTDDLTLTALVGKSETPHKNVYAGVDIFSNIRQVLSRFGCLPWLHLHQPYPLPFGTSAFAAGSKDQG